jgi:RHS repeat-associated protein
VVGTGSSYLEVTYTAPTVGIGTNRQPSIPVLQAPESDSTVVSPVTLSATSIDADGDPIQYYFQGCKNPCATSGVTFDSGWTSSSSWVLSTPIAGESWSWRSYAYDGITPYVIPSADWNFTVGTVSSRPTIWVDDATPAGAVVTGDEPWTWVGVNPSPFSGSTGSQSVIGAGLHQHYFYGATQPLVIAPSGDLLFSYVYLDPANPPSQVMLQFNDGSWEHRAYWGSNQIFPGQENDNNRLMGPLPATGKWIRLEVPPAAIGVAGHSLLGMAFTLVGGRATWDRAGKSGPTVTAPTQAFQESWAWGTTPDYSQISTDNQPNAGVNTGTKRFVYSATDAQVAWSGPALALTRTYNSGDATLGAFGLGWSSILDSRVDVDASQNLTFRLPDGRREYHPFVAGAYRTEPGYWSTAVADPIDGWTLLEKDGTTWRFRADGRLVSAMDRNGRTLLLQYNTATNKVDQIRAVGYNTSRALSITWTGNQVTSVSDGTNATWNYLYSGPFLSKVCDPRNNNTTSGLCTTYVNDGIGRIAQVLKPGGNQDVGISYYGDGTVYARRDGQNNQWAYSYNLGTLVATTTDPLGRVTSEQYNALGQIINRTEPGDGNIPSQTTTFTYDSNGYLAKKTNPVGSWQYVNDYRGNQVQVTDPTGVTSFYSYNNRDEVIAFRDARSASSTDNTYRWTYGYDANGNRVRETNPYGWSRTWAYQTTSNTALPGTLTSETDWLGNTINYTYNGIGDVMSITYPGVAGDHVTYTYDALGRKTSEYGRIALPGLMYTYDSLNAPLTITEPPVTNPLNNAVHRRRITLTYNANHLKSNEVVEDIGGSVIQDAGRNTSYSFDSNDRETSSIDSMGYATSRTFDAVGNVASSVDGRGSTTYTLYNARNLPVSVQVPGYFDPTYQSAASSPTSMSYDGAGRMISKTDGQNYLLTRTFTYDNMNRVLTSVLPYFTDRNGAMRAVTEVSYTYDAIGNITFKRTGTNSLVHAYIYDQAGRLVQDNNQSQPRWDWFTLDRNGNVSSAQRVTTGNVVLSKKDSTYDARNRPLTVTIDMGGTAPNRTTTYTYSPFGTVLTETNPLGGVNRYTYDLLGRLSTSSAPSASHEDLGGVPVSSPAATAKGYDTFGNLTYERDAKGSITTSGFDRNNRRTRVDHPSCSSGCQSIGAYETWSYDQAGNTVSYRDRRGGVTDYLFDSLNRNVQVALPQVGASPRATTQTRYDSIGNAIGQTNEVGAYTGFAYNQSGAIVSASVAGALSLFDYNDLGQLIWQQDPNGNATVNEYLATGELTKTRDAVYAVTTMEYDALGRQTKTTDPMGRVSTAEYTRASEHAKIKRWLNGAVYSTKTATYDLAGNLASTVSPAGVGTQYSYDQMNRLTSVGLSTATSGDSTTSYGYDRNSNLTRTTDGNSNTTTNSFNEWNLQTATVEPSTSAYPALADRIYSTTYDSGGLPVGETKPGTSAARIFDPLGHLQTETWSGPGLSPVTKNYTFDPGGRLTGLNGDTFSYDGRNLLTNAQSTTNGFASYLYDANGNMTSRTIQSGPYGALTTAFAYNSQNRLQTTSNNMLSAQTQWYNLAGQIVGSAHYYSSRGYTYDGLGRLQSDTLYDSPSQTTPLTSMAYTYNSDDNLASKTVNLPGNSSSGVHTYTYDGADRLTGWSGPQGSVAYGYDRAGNRTLAGGWGSTFDQRNRQLTGPYTTYSWTARGTASTQTVGGVTSSFTADAADRVTSVVKPGTTIGYTFDGLDRVAARSLNGGAAETFSYSGLDADPSSSVGAYGSTTPGGYYPYLYNLYFRKPSGELFGQETGGGAGASRTYVARDLHGDAYLWWAGNPQIYGSKQYDPFGSLTNTTGSNIMNIFGVGGWTQGFQGDYTDPTTGDVNMGARWYKPSTGAFQSRDSYMGTLQTPFSLNRYTYGLNNPLRYSDPTGHYAEHAGCYREDGSYDWDCDHALNNDGQGIETDHPLYENADGTAKTNTFDVVDLGNGDSRISVTSSGGTTVSTSSATVRTGTHAAGSTAVSGNLSYTPRAATQEERIILFKQGNTPNAIADAGHDDRKAQGANPSQHASVGSAGTRFLSGSFNNYSMVNPAIAACVAAGPAAPECAAAMAAGTVIIVGGVYIAKNGKKIGRTVVAASKEVAGGIDRAWDWVWNEAVEGGETAASASPTVADVLKGKQGSITNAPLPEGSPSWDDVRGQTMDEIDKAAKAGKIGYKTIKKLLNDKRFNKKK